MDSIAGQSLMDINKSGKIDTVRILLTDGSIVNDTDKWCGAGLKYRGQFEIAVYLDDTVSTYSLNKLMRPEDPASALWFHVLENRSIALDNGEIVTEPWKIEFDDYNGDGQPDFTLGQFAGCNGWRYKLYTIDSKGEVTRMPFTCDCQEELYLNKHDNSVLLDKIEYGFQIEFYNNATGRYRDTFQWWKAIEKFGLFERVPLKDR